MKGCPNLAELGRRQFLRGGATAVAGAAAATVVAPTPAKAAVPAARVDYPSNRLANPRDLKVNEPMDVAYPDPDAPGVLLKLGKRVQGGVANSGGNACRESLTQCLVGVRVPIAGECPDSIQLLTLRSFAENDPLKFDCGGRLNAECLDRPPRHSRTLQLRTMRP